MNGSLNLRSHCDFPSNRRFAAVSTAHSSEVD